MPYLGAVQLATTTLGSSASSVTFSNIPTKLNGLYLRDLILIMTPSLTSTNTDGIGVRFNSDTGSNYSNVYMGGAGSGSGASGSFTTSYISAFPYAGGLTNAGQNSSILQIMDYAATDKHKTTLNRGNDPLGVMANAGRWANTSAISNIVVLGVAQSFASGSKFSLYATVRKP